MDNVTWRFEGACIDDPDPDRWFRLAEIGAPQGLTGLNSLINTCNTCPVKALCLNWAVEHEAWGVWGGTTPKQRQQMRRTLGITLREVA